MIGPMKYVARLRWFSVGALVAASVGCAASHPRSGSAVAARTGALSAPAPAPASGPAADAPAPRKFGTGPTLDRQGCDPTGKATLVVKKGPDGQPVSWKYFGLVKRGGTSVRVLKCEAVDNNGDGYVDARFFYDDRSQLVLEQRDLDFDGHAEVIADYSHFTSGHLVQAE
jgi:hypothetical protein